MIAQTKEEYVLNIKTVLRAFRIPIPLENQIKALSLKNKTTYTDSVITLLVRSLKSYSEKKGVFYCQACSSENPVKKMHLVPVGFEEFIFCDECFFNDKYKEFIRRIL